MKNAKTFWASADKLTQICDGSIQAAATIRDQVKAVPDGENTIENTLEGYNQMLLALDMAYGHAGLMFSVHPDKPIRDAAQKCEQKVAKFASDLGLDPALFKAVSTVDASGADDHTSRFAKHLLIFGTSARPFHRVSLRVTDRFGPFWDQKNSGFLFTCKSPLKNFFS